MQKKIFLLDDERDLTELAKSLLQFEGFEVKTSNNPFDALKVLESDPFDLVVADLMMPGMDGFTFIKTLKTYPVVTKVNIFVLSAKKLSDQERRFILYEGIRFISKPFDPNRLIQLINQTLNS